MGQVVKARADGHCVTVDTWAGSTKDGREFGDICIADCYDEGHPDNTEKRAGRYAKRIAKALNAHDDMLAALEAWHKALERVDFSAVAGINYDSLPWDMTDAAIQKAKESNDEQGEDDSSIHSPKYIS
jgi:hypothetical protein